MYITITGKLGSGKSTVCKIISEKHGYEIYSTGKIQREVAASMGITTLELNERMKTDSSLDHVIDDKTVQISEESVGKDILFDSRLAFHFVKESFKIFAYVSPMEAARRVMGDQRGNVETYQSMEDACAQLLKRSSLENARFSEIYHINNLDYTNYNLIIDTTWATPDEIAEEMMRGLAIYEGDHEMNLYSFSPRSLYSLIPYEALDAEKLAQAKQDLSEGKELAPVKIVQIGQLHYVTEGTERLAAAQLAKNAFIKAVLDRGAVTPKTPDPSIAKAFGEAAGFEYKD